MRKTFIHDFSLAIHMQIVGGWHDQLGSLEFRLLTPKISGEDLYFWLKRREKSPIISHFALLDGQLLPS